MSVQSLPTTPGTIPDWVLRLPPFPYDKEWESEAAWQAAYAKHSELAAARSKWWKQPTIDEARITIEHALQTRTVQANMFSALRDANARDTYVAACEAMIPALIAACPSLSLSQSKVEEYPMHSLSSVSVSAIEKVWWPRSDKAINRIRNLNRLRSPYADTTNTFTHYDRVQRGLDTLGKYFWRGREEQEPEMRLLRCLLLLESCRPWARTPLRICAVSPHRTQAAASC